MLRALKEFFAPHEPTTFFRVGSSYPIEVPVSILQLISFSNPARNIAEAQENGIKPVNFHQICEQFPKEQILNSVLFDTPPSGIRLGNHWRIVGLDDKRQLVTIQLCGGPFGNHDTDIPPFTVSQYDILFTGMSTPEYQRYGHPISLFRVNELIRQGGLHETPNPVYPKGLKMKKETIYWADANGKLAPTGRRLI